MLAEALRRESIEAVVVRMVEALPW
jgi:hypothetical protein